MHVSFEHVCSGIGIPEHYYEYLRDLERRPEGPRGRQAGLVSRKTSSVVVVDNAFNSPQSKLCSETIDFFAGILASEAGNIALKFLATGGVYLGGGVVAHTLPALERPNFWRVSIAKDVLPS